MSKSTMILLAVGVVAFMAMRKKSTTTVAGINVPTEWVDYDPFA